ncbi:hypothetical protein COCCADRAFT_103706 [Bipolaris zeicola 26-R-13]|uniref:(S)-ureidoglycine aminohydrolase cupin domain-containing protein n=1 Tax=Cochliobolus carbonum (strain 26-R-13) TaxID=930089 RepID=W6Y5R3_COCC2|nr:uncharacterized protein COCCADRAFT_103706 [Bipolaris zeicola 26-R-13]EUC30524.1 hypothetical protein COCCADRAFT_103706 [Bipolaris zeicola 26-R-13]
MPVEFKSATERYKLTDQVDKYVFFDDIFNSKGETTQDPLAGIWFRIEKGPPIGPGLHGYDESGVVYEGTVTLKDETGMEKKLGPGDSFFIHRGSKVLFSSDDCGVCFKCAARPKGKL